MVITKKQIVDDLADTDFLVFVGSGISCPTKVDTWPELMNRLNDGLQEVSGDTLSGVNVKEIDGLLYPELAQMFYEKFCELGVPDKYFDIVKEGTKSKATTDTGTQHDLLLASLKNSIVTTNFDSTIEEAYKRLIKYKQIDSEMSIQTLDSLNNNIENCQITYLHGRYDSNEIILKTSDYEKYYSGHTTCKKLYDFLKYLYRNQTLVFAGFSFTDRYLLNAIKRIHEEEVESQAKNILTTIIPRTKHYAFLPSLLKINLVNIEPKRKMEMQKQYDKSTREREGLIIFLGRLGIEVYEYEADCHEEIGRIMQDIIGRRESGAIS